MKEAPFYVGQKVVCVDVPDYWPSHAAKLGVSHPRKNEIVTIKGIRLCICNCGEMMLEFYEHGNGFAFQPECFRPIEENTYKNISKELAVLPQDEISDVKIKQLVN